ncbi:MAG: mandelate racemase/muconate lactonizing enzyme family protein [Alphaproteobacteria bacterium]|nr:mandelate racemase/muconate lactonizing enzyme family protein [Alphaproteobacteria bacterium]
MKIQSVETFVVGNPPPGFGGRYFVFVKLETSNGIVGYGEAYAATFGPHVVAAMIEDVAERHVIGQSPFRIEETTRRIYGSGYTLRPDVSLGGVTSALEMAMWDIVGKAVGQPVYNLLGGKVHERLRSYTYLYPRPGDRTDVYADPELAAERALEEVARGFTAVKFDPAGPYSVYDGHMPSREDISRSIRFVKLLREAVGDKADLLFGTHGQFTAAGAIRLGRAIAPYDPLWFEEPTPPDNPEEMAKVARAVSIPVATGERLTNKFEFAAVMRADAAAILQMNLGRVGGLLEAKKIAGMAETHYVQIAPHLYCGPLVAAANIQLATCSPNFLILEAIQDFGGFYADLLETKIGWEDGAVTPPTEPGLGVVLNEAVARAHPYTGDGLHLEMAPDPVR